MSKGKSGSFRANSLTQSDLKAMENHELRLDHSGARRSIRKDDQGFAIPPLIYNPLRANSLTQAKDMHIGEAKVNKAASKVARHAFIQFPTDLEITAQTEQLMLDQAVAFVNNTHGGQAVFWARLDRDEAGRHGVDVFFAPKYEKVTKRKTEVWVSLTKFGKERAVERFKQKPLEKKNPETEKFEPVKDADGNPIMVDCDSKYYQGRAFQDLWFEHLRDEVGLKWVQRGTQKVGRDPDRLEVEEYKLQQEEERLKAEMDAVRQQNIEQQRSIERTGHKAIEARNALMAKARDQADALISKAEDEAARIVAAARQRMDVRAEELSAKEAELSNRERMIASKEVDLSTILEKRAEWLDRATANLSIALERAIKGIHDKEITPSDMAGEEAKYSVLKRAAPDQKPTWGFRARFWSMNYSDGSGPVPDKYLPAKLRAALNKAFDTVAIWARKQLKHSEQAMEAIQKLQASAQRDAEALIQAARDEAADEAQRVVAEASKQARTAASSILDNAHAEANNMLSEARSRAVEVLSAEKQLWANHTQTNLIKDAVRHVFGEEGHQKIADRVNAVWRVHPDNVNRDVPRPSTSYSSPPGP